MSVNWGDLPLEVVNQILKIHEENELRWWIETMENHKKQGDTLCPKTLRHTLPRAPECMTWISAYELHPEWIPSGLKEDKVVRGEEKRMIELYVNRSRIVRHLFGTIQERRDELERKGYLIHRGDGVYETPGWMNFMYEDCVYDPREEEERGRYWINSDDAPKKGAMKGRYPSEAGVRWTRESVPANWVDRQFYDLLRTHEEVKYKVDPTKRKVFRERREEVGRNNPDLVFKIRNRQEMEDIAEKEKEKLMGFGKGKTKCSRCGLIGHTKNNALCPALSDYKFGVVMNFTTDE